MGHRVVSGTSRPAWWSFTCRSQAGRHSLEGSQWCHHGRHHESADVGKTKIKEDIGAEVFAPLLLASWLLYCIAGLRWARVRRLAARTMATIGLTQPLSIGQRYQLPHFRLTLRRDRASRDRGGWCSAPRSVVTGYAAINK